jgi:hypothetical protein
MTLPRFGSGTPSIKPTPPVTLRSINRVPQTRPLPLLVVVMVLIPLLIKAGGIAPDMVDTAVEVVEATEEADTVVVEGMVVVDMGVEDMEVEVWVWVCVNLAVVTIAVRRTIFGSVSCLPTSKTSNYDKCLNPLVPSIISRSSK